MIHSEIKKIFEQFELANNITYDGRRHSYKLDGVTCAGVSTISEYQPKEWLKPWAAKMVVEHLKDKQDFIKTCTPEEYTALLLEAKKMHKTKSEEALDIGTQVHDLCERLIMGMLVSVTEETKNPIDQFLAFQKNHKVEWICTEKIVCSPTHLVAGRLDSLAFVDGILSLVDLKTSSRISESYFLQTAGYSMCLSEMGVPIERRIILRLPKVKDDTFEAVEVDTPLEEDIKAFLAQRYAYAWANMIDCKHTDKINNGKFIEKKLKLKLI